MKKSELEEKIKELEERIKELENYNDINVWRGMHERIGPKQWEPGQNRLTWPEQIKKLLPPYTPDFSPNFPKEKPVCQTCGKKYEDMSNYCCPRSDCPGKVTCECK